MLGTHSLGLYEKALDPSDDWPARLTKAKALGFDYMEISIDEQDERIKRLYWPRQRIKDLRDQCFDLQLPLRSICLSVHRRFPFGSADAHTQMKAYEMMERAIIFAQELGARVIQLAGYDVYYEESTARTREDFLRGIEWSARQAAKHQVMLGMEIMDTPFMNSITKHLSYEKQINSPWYRTYPDLGNLSAWNNDVRAELKKGIGSIVAVHLKDTLKGTHGNNGVFRDVPFGVGCVDFKMCFRLLEELGYAGPYLMEMWNLPGDSDVEEVQKGKACIEAQFAAAVAE